MTIAVECPHPSCQGKIKIGGALPAGTYQCICHMVEVRLQWTPEGPALSLADGAADG